MVLASKYADIFDRQARLGRYSSHYRASTSIRWIPRESRIVPHDNNLRPSTPPGLTNLGRLMSRAHLPRANGHLHRVVNLEEWVANQLVIICHYSMRCRENWLSP